MEKVNNKMKEIKKLNYLYKIEEIQRYGEVKDRAESTAEHIATSMILANYFLEIIEENLDYKKVNQILLFHDLIEIESKDTFILDDERLKTQYERELEAFEIVSNKFPTPLKNNYINLIKEYNESKTREAKFVKAIDNLDPMIQALEKKYLWKKYNFTEEKLREKKQKYFEEFPEILKIFEEILKYFNENKYF